MAKVKEQINHWNNTFDFTANTNKINGQGGYQSHNILGTHGLQVQ
jgi:hypothetical protein